MNTGLKKNIPVSGPSITEKEIEMVRKAAESAWYSGAGAFIKEFEENFAKYCNRKYAISLPSCTSGLHLALLALGIKEGDEVIVPDVTWIASAAPISYVGAIPVFCDVSEQNLCLNLETIRKSLTPRVKAIIAVNLYGAMPNYPEIIEFCNSNNIHLIEDAAESIGSRLNGAPSGSFGDFSVFSFHGSKTLTTGEGGMLLTDNDYLYERCMILRDHGRTPGDTLFQNKEIGYKYKMSDLQAALGIAQLERVQELVDKKREIFTAYKEHLSDMKDILKIDFESANVFNSYWMTSVVWDQKRFPISKFELIQKLKEFKIDSRPVFSPLSSLPAYSHLNTDHTYSNKNEVSYRYKDCGINLPSALNLTTSDILEVSQALRVIFKQY